jgi:excisionase family DNA binding protein
MTAPTTTGPEQGTKVLYTVEDARHLLSMGRSKIYELLRTGRLRSVHEGGSRRISAAAIAEYVALLEQEATVDR